MPLRRLFSTAQQVALLSLLFFFSGCFPPRTVPPTTVPIETLKYETARTRDQRLLFVYLPGYGDPISAFQENGLVDAVRERGLATDIIAVNAHIGYYLDGSIFARLKEDVIEPAKTRGYDQIWLVGNSLGGYGALSYARDYPNDITGVVLLGPFLGRKDVVNEIKRSGGLSQWDPGMPEPNDREQYWEKHLWLWIKDRVQQERFWFWVRGCEVKMHCIPKVYLGYGLHDRYSYGQEFLASFMPPHNVIAIRGGHDWSTWKKLWNLFLDRGIFKEKGTIMAAPVENGE